MFLNSSTKTMIITATTTIPTTSLTTTTTKQHSISVAIVFAAIALFMAFENYLVIFTVAAKRFRRLPDILIFTLSLSGLLNSFTVITIVVYHRAADSSGQDGINWLCKVQFWFATTLRNVDIFTITLISVDRYIALTKPFFYRARVRPAHGWWAVLTTTLASGLISILPFFGFGSISRVVPSLCVAGWDSKISIVIVAVAYVQFAIVLFCYMSVMCTIRKFVQRQKAMANSQRITYESRGLDRSISNSCSGTSLSRETSCTSLELSSIADDSRGLRIKAALNRSLSNVEVEDSGSLDNNVTGKDPDGSIARNSIYTICSTRALGNIAEYELAGVDDKEVADSIACNAKERSTTVESSCSSTSAVGLEVAFASHGKYSMRSLSNIGEYESTGMVDTNSDVGMAKDANLDKGTAVSEGNYVTQKGLRRCVSTPVDLLNKRGSLPENVYSQEPVMKNRGNWKVNIGKQLSSVRKKFKLNESFLRKKQTEERRQWKESQHFAKVMGVVVLIFYISWLPLAIGITLTLLIGATEMVLKITYISLILTLGSPLLIPIVYGVMAKSYRHGYQKALCWLCCCFCKLADRPAKGNTHLS
eukprot:gene15201-16770_t